MNNNEITERLLRVLADDLPWTIEQLHAHTTINYGLTLDQTSDFLNKMVAERSIVPAYSSEHGHGFTIAGTTPQAKIRDLALAVVKAEALVTQKHQESSLWGHPDTWERPGITRDQAAAKVRFLHLESCAAKAALSQDVKALTVELCEGNDTPSIERESVSIDISSTSALVCGWWEDGTGYEMQLTARI